MLVESNLSRLAESNLTPVGCDQRLPPTMPCTGRPFRNPLIRRADVDPNLAPTVPGCTRLNHARHGGVTAQLHQLSRTQFDT